MANLDLTTWANLHGVNVRTARQWAKKGLLEGADMPGKVWLIPSETLPPVLHRGNPNFSKPAPIPEAKPKDVETDA